MIYINLVERQEKSYKIQKKLLFLIIGWKLNVIISSHKLYKLIPGSQWEYRFGLIYCSLTTHSIEEQGAVRQSSMYQYTHIPSSSPQFMYN